jgi:hypothetical protein
MYNNLWYKSLYKFLDMNYTVDIILFINNLNNFNLYHLYKYYKLYQILNMWNYMCNILLHIMLYRYLQMKYSKGIILFIDNLCNFNLQYSNSNYTQNRCNSTEYLYLDLFQFYIPLVSSKNWNKIKNSKMSSSNRVIHLEVANPDLL